MSNARIAQTLVISEKTAGHHVSRILMKLGVSNRAEAAAHAVRAGFASSDASERRVSGARSSARSPAPAAGRGT